MIDMNNFHRRVICYAKMEENRVSSIIFASLGVFVGIIIALLVISALPLDIKALNKAKELGIVSVTIFKGYPGTQQTKNYMVGLLTSIPIAILVWYLWATIASFKTKFNSQFSILNSQFLLSDERYGIEAKTLWLKIVDFVIIPMAIVFFTFHINMLHSYWDWGNLGFLGEEGEHLAWVNAILHGKVLYKDTFCLYGPLIYYPLAGLMKVFGPSRIYPKSLFLYDQSDRDFYILFIFKKLFEI